MKTKLVIEFETKEMKTVVPEEYPGTPGKCPKEEEMTEEIEKGLHEEFISRIKEFESKDSYLYEDLQSYLMEDEKGVEGFETLDDYGNISFKVEELKEKGD